MKTIAFLRSFTICMTFLLAMGSCTRYEDASVDPSILPEITSARKSVVACVIHQTIYRSDRVNQLRADVFKDNNQNDFIYVRFPLDELHPETGISFRIVNPKEKETAELADFYLYGEQLTGVKVYIETMTNQYVKGTFEGGEVQYGRFLIYYKDNMFN